VINPAGGHTGLENRLYRVEIHTTGTVDGATKATFKWSRDNASVAARVLSINQITATDCLLTVGSTGRDAELSFKIGDHVELLDDDVELAMRETGMGGLMGKVTNVNAALGEIHVGANFGGFFIAVPTRHPRIRRWDFATAGEPLQRGTNNGVAIPLEKGISITFGSAATDTLHAGDHWVFAARTADGSIDTLVKQPPRNTLHHFARLALVTVGSAASPTDCRIPWPSPGTPTPGPLHEGCCSKVVQVGESIQAAIDDLEGIGGCVCLKMGTHFIEERLHIAQDNITIHGEVPWVTIQLRQGSPLMLEILNATNVSVLGIQFFAPDSIEPEPIIGVSGVSRGRIADCDLQLGGGKANPNSTAFGIVLENCQDYSVESVRMTNLPRAVLGVGSSDIRVLDNRFIGPTVTKARVISLGLMGVQFDQPDGVTGIYIERNVLSDYQRGIQLGNVDLKTITAPGKPIDVARSIEGCRVVANEIIRQPGPEGGGGAAAFAIAAHVARCEIAENTMEVASYSQHGILVAGGNTLVHRNEVRSTAAFEELPRELPSGVTAVEMLDDALLCSIRGNLFTGLLRAVVASGTGSGSGHRVDILDNRIEGNRAPLAAVAAQVMAPGAGNPVAALLTFLDGFSAIRVEDLSHCRIADNEIRTAVCGVTIAGSGDEVSVGGSVVANRVSASLAGVVVDHGIACGVNDNLIDAALDPNTPAIVVGFFGVGFFLVSRCTATGNVVSRCGQGLVSTLSTSLRLESNEVYATQIGIESVSDTDLVLRGNNVEDAALTGITTNLSLHELTLANNRTLRCGYRGETPGAGPPLPAIGIDVRLAIALVTIEGCHVIDTGESADSRDKPFGEPRFGIRVQESLGTRIRGCEVASSPLVKVGSINTASRAVLMETSHPEELKRNLNIVPFADATDNVIEQSVMTLVEINIAGEIMFATNRCMNFSEGDGATVLLTGTHATVTGNRIRGGSKGLSLNVVVTSSKAVAAVGNMTSGPGVFSPVEHPSPYASFNVITP